MNRKIMVAVSSCLVLLFLLWLGTHFWLGEDNVSAEEVREKVAQQYKGKISFVEEHKGSYLVAMTLETGDYELEVSKEDGAIIRLQRTKELSSKKDTSDKQKEKTQPLTEDQARDIALQRVSGHVDDVDYESSDEGSYFLVEIERKNGSEVTVQVNDVTGKVMSISWDD